MDSWTTLSSSTALLPAVVTATSAVVASGIYWYCTNCKQKQQPRGKAAAAATTTQASNKLKNIWDAPRNATSREKKQHENKPFGSSYYYAHNNPNATGGYKDGLRMEDYTMNGPRLLAKGGKPVVSTSSSMASSTTSSVGGEEEEKASNDQQDNNNNSNLPQTTSPSDSSSSSIVIRHITKYLWDDPGDHAKGCATIRIDKLPSIQGTSNVEDWKDVTVDRVEATLVGEGLRVQVYSQKAHYLLHIAKLYGDVASVKAIVKPKRLLVQLTKKKKGFLSGNPNNLDAWPQPHRKV